MVACLDCLSLHPGVAWGATGLGSFCPPFSVGATFLAAPTPSVGAIFLAAPTSSGSRVRFTWHYIGLPTPLAVDLAYESVWVAKTSALATPALALQPASLDSLPDPIRGSGYTPPRLSQGRGRRSNSGLWYGMWVAQEWGKISLSPSSRPLSLLSLLSFVRSLPA